MTSQRNPSRRIGQEIRAWPVLALLLVAVLGAIGGVLWFMREAMENGRLAARQKVVEAYRGQLELLQKQVETGWRLSLALLDGELPAPARFARAAREDRADAIVALDADGRPAYPAGRVETRDAEANALLLKLEQAEPGSPPFASAAVALQARVNEYGSDSMPSSQRRFLMRELQRQVPGAHFPTLAAEDLAARYLEEHPEPERSEALRATRLRDVWASTSPGGHAIALFSSARLRAALQGLAGAAAPTTRAQVIPPGEAVESALVSSALGPAMPGWQLAISAEEAWHSDATADRAASIYLWTAGALIAGLAVIGTLVARGLGRQVKLARLKTDLVAMVSHELKTPLTGMRALVDTLLDAEKLEEKTTREYLELLARENARLSALIENFLTFSRLERNKFTFRFEPVPPAELVDAAVAAMGERCHAPECQLETCVAPDLPSVRGDRGALTTALLNLLDNAWKYTGEQKRISVRAEVRNGSVYFAVEDNGIGLGAKERARVFDRFYQADQRLAREVGGCGLGLSIAQAIAEAHEGAVSVASEAGRGSTFTLEIPLHSQ